MAPRRREIPPELRGVGCVARCLPLKERRMRACGLQAVGVHDGRALCRRHLTRAETLEALRG